MRKFNVNGNGKSYAVEEEEVAIFFHSSLSPCIIKAEEGNWYKYLILPLRL